MRNRKLDFPKVQRLLYYAGVSGICIITSMWARLPAYFPAPFGTPPSWGGSARIEVIIQIPSHYAIFAEG